MGGSCLYMSSEKTAVGGGSGSSSSQAAFFCGAGEQGVSSLLAAFC